MGLGSQFWCVAMCAQVAWHASCQQEWHDLLMAFGWNKDSARLLRLCEMVVCNDLYKWFQLVRAGDPSTWKGAEVFDKEELDILRKLVTNGVKRPR